MTVARSHHPYKTMTFRSLTHSLTAVYGSNPGNNKTQPLKNVLHFQLDSIDGLYKVQSFFLQGKMLLMSKMRSAP